MPRPRRSAPRAYGSLSREEILDAALALADSEGIEGLSMRTLAKVLGSAPMSLYRHFRDRAALEQALVDHVIGGSDLGDPTRAKPRAFVRGAFLEIRATLLAHPQILPLLGTRSSLGPEALGDLEVILRALEASGLRPREAVRAIHLLMGFTLGATLIEARMLGTGASSEPVGLHAADVGALPLLGERVGLLMEQMSDAGFASALDVLLETLLGD